MRAHRYPMIVAASLLAVSAFAGVDWETDFEEAKADAKASNKYMLLDFTGSDWCGWCMKLDKEVFKKKEFAKYADKNLVAVELDFPRRRKQKKALREQNAKLAKQYSVRGYPTVLVLSPDGDLVGRTGYQKGGPDAYVKHLQKMIDPHRKKHGIPAPGNPGAATESSTAVVKKLPVDENREVRSWRSVTGAELKASVVKEMGSSVVLKKEDGSSVMIPKARLSAEDRAYIEGLKTAESSSE